MRTLVVPILALAVSISGSAFGASRNFSAADLVQFRRVASVTASPDGKQFLYVLRETDLSANTTQKDIWSQGLSRRSVPIRLTSGSYNEDSPVWSRDGKRIYFTSTKSGSEQIWSMSADGSNQRQISNFPVNVAGFKLSPDGARLVFWADVFPDCATLQCTADRQSALKSAKATGRVYDKLFIRHWDTWKDGTRSQLFTTLLRADDALDTPVQVSRGIDGDVPSKPMGGSDEISFAPDGKTLYFAQREAAQSEAWSTNLDIFSVPVDGSAAPRNLTTGMMGMDTSPRLSPDGKFMAWLSMPRAGFESDKQRLMLRDLASGATRDVTAGWDRSISAFSFAQDGRSVIAIAQHLGTTPLWRIDLASGKVVQLTKGGSVGEFDLAGRDILLTRHDLAHPADIFRLKQSGGALQQLTQVNADSLRDIAMGEARQFSFKGWNSETVYGWVVSPANAKPRTKYPVAFLVHGGPQTSFGDQFHYRWNAQAYAGRGYAVVMIDYHGSSGYGQAFTDSISGDWGGKPLEDLRAGWTAALRQFDFLNEDKACALGGSYGGYMMAWIASQWPDEFQCLVNHDGVFDKRAMAYTTEELWFDIWENGGRPYTPGIDKKIAMNDPAGYVDLWRTPTLVIHGEKDFRVPLTQGIGTFSALQMKGVPSRLLVFPDENHWVLKPANTVQWHDEVLGWLDRWLQPEK